MEPRRPTEAKASSAALESLPLASRLALSSLASMGLLALQRRFEAEAAQAAVAKPVRQRRAAWADVTDGDEVRSLASASTSASDDERPASPLSRAEAA